MHVELIGTHRFQCGNNPRQVFGQTAGHHRINRDFFNREFDQIRWSNGNYLFRGPQCSAQHTQHSCFCWWDDGESIGPAASEQCIHVIFESGNFDSARVEDGTRMTDTQIIDQIWIHAK